jgi:PPOX class probable F420-dependent enzyme
MDISEAQEFLRDNNRAVLATFRKDGSVQMSPVTVTVDDDARVLISSRESAYKVRNLRRDSRASVCVFTERFFGKWVFVEGGAEIVSLPEAMEGLVDYYRRAAGEHPDWDDYRAAMERDRRVLVRIPIEKAGPNQSG